MMETKLSINDKCELIATPVITEENILNNVLDSVLDPCFVPEESESKNTIYLEFLLSSEIKNPIKTAKISTNRDFYVYPLKTDGLYVYYLMEITTVPENKNKGLYYNLKESDLYLNGKVVNDLTYLVEVIPTLNEGEGLIDFLSEEIFSICKLKKCLLELQKQSISTYKSGKCKNIDSNKHNRDFLFISIYILENLICNERYTEAIEIVKSIEGCGINCNSSTNKTRCNCG